MTDRDPLDDLIAGLRTDVPELTDEAFTASRARLRTAIEPVPVATGPRPDPVVVPLPRKRLLRSPPRRLIATAAAAVVLAAGVLFVQAVPSDGPVPAASAAATLNSAADNINPVDEPIEPGQYRYIASRSRNLGQHLTVPTDGGVSGLFIALDEWTHQEWVPADLTQQCVLRFRATGREWIVGDEDSAEEAGVEPLSTTAREEVKPCTAGGDWSRYPSAEFLESVTRDPRRLYALLRHKPAPVTMSDAEWVLDRASATLSSGRAPADLRAALYRALALLPGLEVTERVANLDGHRGTALGLTEHGIRSDLIIDPATGQYIGERTVYVSEDFDVPRGTIFSSTAVSNPVIVDAVGATR